MSSMGYQISQVKGALDPPPSNGQRHWGRELGRFKGMQGFDVSTESIQLASHHCGPGLIPGLASDVG